MITPSASTLGAPGIPVGTVLEWLQQHRIRGIELRLAPGEAADPAMDLPSREELRQQINNAGVTVTGIASYVKIAGAGDDEAVIARLINALDFANDLGAPVVRVFPGAPTGPAAYTQAPRLVEPRDEVNERAARRLTAVTGYAAALGILPALETHDSHPTGKDIASILQQVRGPVGAVWDLMHPWRVGERLEETWETLEPWLSSGLGSVQVKDANMPASNVPVPVGAGTLPTEEFARLLVSTGYHGPVILEWEKAWHPQAAPLDVALGSVRTWIDRHWDKDTN